MMKFDVYKIDGYNVLIADSPQKKEFEEQQGVTDVKPWCVIEAKTTTEGIALLYLRSGIKYDHNYVKAVCGECGEIVYNDQRCWSCGCIGNKHMETVMFQLNTDPALYEKVIHDAPCAYCGGRFPVGRAMKEHTDVCDKTPLLQH